MEHKEFRFDAKQLDAPGEFEGLLSPYGKVDLGGDLIERGAYAKSIAEHKGRIPLLLGHRETSLVGDLFLQDRADGLFVRGVLDLDLTSAKDVHINVTKKRLRALSIGYAAVKARVENGVRRLSEIRLYEGSLVLYGMAPEAQVTAVKAQQDHKELLALLEKFEMFGARR